MKVKRLFLIVVVCLFVSTCTTDNRLPGHVHYRLNSNPTTLDPALIVDVNGGAIAAKLFNGLVKLGDDLQIESDIADRWTVSADGKTYRFFLKKGVLFSSGREVHAWDFKYSFERVLDPETKSSQTWIFEHISGAKKFMDGEAEDVEGIRVIDDYSMEIRLDEPFSPFLGLLTMPSAYVVPMEEVLHWDEDFSSHPVGTGPYALTEWLPNRHLILEGREDYFDGTPKVRGIMYRIIPEDLTSITEYELGNLDLITIPASEYLRYKRSEKWSGLLSSTVGINTYYLGMNCQQPPFDDPEIRRAMNYAIDRKKILETLLEGRGLLASGPVPEILRGWPSPEAYQYDADMARELLGRLEDKEVDFIITTDQQVVDMAEVIQAYLEDAGLKVRIKPLEWSAFKEAINRGEADMFWLSWWADYPDPENFLFPTFHSTNHGSGGNRARYTNPEVDSLIEKGQSAVSEEKKNDFYGKAERIIAADAPWVFFWHKMDTVIRQPWVKNLRLYPVYSMDKGLDIEI